MLELELELELEELLLLLEDEDEDAGDDMQGMKEGAVLTPCFLAKGTASLPLAAMRITPALALVLALGLCAGAWAQNTTAAPTDVPTTTLPDIFQLIGYSITTTDLIYAGAGFGALLGALFIASCVCAVSTTQCCNACNAGGAKCCGCCCRSCRKHAYKLSGSEDPDAEE